MGAEAMFRVKRELLSVTETVSAAVHLRVHRVGFMLLDRYMKRWERGCHP